MVRKSTKRTKKLITEGKKKGHLTYEEINEILPDDIITPEDIDDILSTLDNLNIEVVSSTEEYHKKKEAVVPKVHPQVERAKFYDPIRAYLHQMGRIPLLSRQEEIKLAKEIDEGTKNIKRMLKKLIAEDVFNFIVKKKNMVNLVYQLKENLNREDEGFLPEGYTEREWQLDEQKLREYLPEIEREAERVMKTKEKMIKSNLRLVVSIAKKYINRGLPLLDLIQEGNMGLMRAVDKFEYRRGYKFSTYATWW
ncbi:MAG TPA: sigma-70 family RNA polymerase sigma factor, partial [Candidatus Omnitrophica bacterium]|nr:sigma-70 family RNA polymerase sigma factor [Candidatus Omnitrophota bacterium]